MRVAARSLLQLLRHLPSLRWSRQLGGPGGGAAHAAEHAARHRDAAARAVVRVPEGPGAACACAGASGRRSHCHCPPELQKLYVADLNKMAAKSSIEALIGGAGGVSSGGGGEDEDEVDEGMSDAQMSAMANMQEDTDERIREIQARWGPRGEGGKGRARPHDPGAAAAAGGVVDSLPRPPLPLLLQRIAKSVEDLAVLFRELNTLIVEQGTMLDRIDHNIEEVRGGEGEGGRCAEVRAGGMRLVSSLHP